ncbi:cation diffusion facilitator family transporter [Paenibacillus farraposensis]|uniref:Cation diffusion facilitator family transporter n=1 Tax=Paenibacillus farraposensis TaxID=2807095 RepID=A0ABW4DCY8_9BACL|nr:cation diffusion facilitator family transporter [Paenibacillus farraposensis]MCC3378911.1 cation diffusion facilitator family transporter [Paenibacillus farraposensis]
MNSERSRSLETTAWSGIVGSLALAVLKGTVGYAANSKALLGDALYTAADSAFRLQDLLSKDGTGHGMLARLRNGEKVRAVISVVLAILVLMSGLQLAISAVRSLSSLEPQAPSLYALTTVFVALVLREVLFQFQYRYSIKHGHKAEAGMYANHERYSLYASLIALIGMIGAMTGKAMEWPALLYLDPTAALLVACMVMRKGYLMVMNTAYQAPAKPLREEDSQCFMETIQRVYGIVTIEHFHAQKAGHFVMLDVTISVNPRITVQEAQEIADRAKNLLMSRFPQVTHVQMQFISYQAGYPYKTNHELPDNDVSSLLQ